ncbi:hypothetical protein [Streptomyces sp. NPDC058476]|uniref:hypothetical protein n=1 Tax=Streptomyces sp. NPDC058476 TaxID=3346519 RepID=UPI00364BA501
MRGSSDFTQAREAGDGLSVLVLGEPLGACGGESSAAWGCGIELQDECPDLLTEGLLDARELTHVWLAQDTGEVLGPGLDAALAACLTQKGPKPCLAQRGNRGRSGSCGEDSTGLRVGQAHVLDLKGGQGVREELA